MTSDKNTVQEAAQSAASLPAITSRKATIAIKTPVIARIRTKTSNLPEEQQDKLLFEVFDMLLRNDRQDLSPARVVLSREKCKVKEKVATAPARPTTQTKAWQDTQQS